MNVPCGTATRQLRITLVHENRQYEMRIYPDQSAELLQHQIWSITSLPPTEQMVTGLVDGPLTEASSLAGVQDGTWAILQRTAPAASARPSPTSSHDTAGMEARLASGLQTAQGHRDPGQLSAALAVVPWEKICADAKAMRLDSHRAAVRRALAASEAASAIATAVKAARSQPRLPAGAMVDRVRFVPLETRELLNDCTQLARLRLFDASVCRVELKLSMPQTMAGAARRPRAHQMPPTAVSPQMARLQQASPRVRGQFIEAARMRAG